ncbi:hypothetical protein DSM106972_031180 [Dulcicalothrix desertica PCC 7102]|uniref:Toxin n=1 Tax=Dulcicalothrix desertica PCC 7102 TaxID=232991 RepID=A0A433VIK8_9CYAN|nr:BrnT family toxin [Dulcicalothrix desertica]RUT05912.1 hypothetical protein DSM106972_031180 [Dulcicalothrix desertica PCC 7102]TWH54391.1 hypothetical protein CAL7102_02421 [Dulcicalothrix desertica PCC 7102]
MEFEWDENKAKRNQEKHAVSFDEAKTAFDDPLYLIFPDPDHSIGEKRFIIMGNQRKTNYWLYLIQNVVKLPG